MSLTWNIDCCYTVDQVSGHEDLGRIICGADYKVSDSFGVIETGYVVIPTDSLNSFTAYNSVTEANVIEWVKAALGTNKIAMIQNKSNQRGKPWQT